MKKKSRNLRYKLDYITFWKQQGMYGEIRIFRTKERKKKRFEKWVERRKRNRGSWWENGRMIQRCEMGGTCEWPCNGDC